MPILHSPLAARRLPANAASAARLPASTPLPVSPMSSADQQLRSPTASVFPVAGRLPLVGLGTWTQRREGEVEAAVRTAIE